MSGGEGQGAAKGLRPDAAAPGRSAQKGDIPRSADVTAGNLSHAARGDVRDLGGPRRLQHADSVLMIFLQPARPADQLAKPSSDGGARARRHLGASAGAGAAVSRADGGGTGQPVRPTGGGVLGREARARCRASPDPVGMPRTSSASAALSVRQGNASPSSRDRHRPVPLSPAIALSTGSFGTTGVEARIFWRPARRHALSSL